MAPISRVALRTLASSAFESLSGSWTESAETAVRSISIGAAWEASRSITRAVSSDSVSASVSPAVNPSSSSRVGRCPRRIRNATSS